MNKKTFRATEEQPMEPVGSQQHKAFIDGLVKNPVPPYRAGEREQIYDELVREDMRHPFKIPVVPLFDELADASLDRVKSTYTHAHEEGRGAQYGDTMRMCQFLTVDAVDAELQVNHPHRRLAIFLAGMVDMKLERMRGGYRDDNLVDLIAYAAALAELMRRK